jgi:hypothetical protein
MSARHVCDIAPAGWQCLRDHGHDGPCAAAPLTGSGACPDIGKCLDQGRQSKCGPDEQPRMSLKQALAQAFGWFTPGGSA